jgi:hypothetical protein
MPVERFLSVQKEKATVYSLWQYSSMRKKSKLK